MRLYLFLCLHNMMEYKYPCKILKALYIHSSKKKHVFSVLVKTLYFNLTIKSIGDIKNLAITHNKAIFNSIYNCYFSIDSIYSSYLPNIR